MTVATLAGPVSQVLLVVQEILVKTVLSVTLAGKAKPVHPVHLAVEAATDTQAEKAPLRMAPVQPVSLVPTVFQESLASKVHAATQVCPALLDDQDAWVQTAVQVLQDEKALVVKAVEAATPVERVPGVELQVLPDFQVSRAATAHQVNLGLADEVKRALMVPLAPLAFAVMLVLLVPQDDKVMPEFQVVSEHALVLQEALDDKVETGDKVNQVQRVHQALPDDSSLARS